MLDFFEFGEQLFSTLQSLGDFLLHTKFSLSADLLNGIVQVLDILVTAVGLRPLGDLLSMIDFSQFAGEFTIGYLVIGGGLVIIIVFRFVKFFTDIVL